jgi:hypothetical protein
LPSGLNATEKTHAVCPWRRATVRRLATSHIWTFLSPLAARVLPSGLKATQ